MFRVILYHRDLSLVGKNFKKLKFKKNLGGYNKVIPREKPRHHYRVDRGLIKGLELLYNSVTYVSERTYLSTNDVPSYSSPFLIHVTQLFNARSSQTQKCMENLSQSLCGERSSGLNGRARVLIGPFKRKTDIPHDP